MATAVYPEQMDLEKIAATSAFQQKCIEVRSAKVNWQSYLQGQMISLEDYHFVSKLDGATTADQRTAVIRDNANQCAKTLITLMTHISKDQTVQYVLTLIDDVLQEDNSRVEVFREYASRRKESVFTPFLNMLTRPDVFIVNQSARIITKLACWSTPLLEGNNLTYFLTWLRDQLKMTNNEYIQNVVRCLQMLLRVDEYRVAFATSIDGLGVLVDALAASKSGFQLQYQLVFCFWLLSFNSDIALRISKLPTSTIPLVADILGESSKEKVCRISVAFLRNLLEKTLESDVASTNAAIMVQFKVLKYIELFEQRKYTDEELVENIEFLKEKLENSVLDLSSFDEYANEVRGGRLEWSPVHRSDLFWRENAPRLNEKNFELLKMLVKLLEISHETQVLAIAAHDVGEYVRYYPRGKTVLEQLGAKQTIMGYLTHEDSNVRYEALIAVQKMMVHNWEYLGKQLAVDNKENVPGQASTSSSASTTGSAPKPPATKQR